MTNLEKIHKIVEGSFNDIVRKEFCQDFNTYWFVKTYLMDDKLSVHCVTKPDTVSRLSEDFVRRYYVSGFQRLYPTANIELLSVTNEDFILCLSAK